MAKRRGARNSVNQQVLDDIIKMFGDALGFSEEKIKELYDENQALKAAGGTPGAGSPVNVNYQGDITNANLQSRLVTLMETIIDKVQNDPAFGQGNNVNIQIGFPKKRTTTQRRRSTTPRVTNQVVIDTIKDYITQRADQIVQLIQNIHVPQPTASQPTQPSSCTYDGVALRQLITTVAQDIKTQYSSIDSRLAGLEGTASVIADTTGRTEGAVGRVEGAVGSFDARLGRIEGSLGKLDNLVSGQVLLFQGQTRLTGEHDRLSKGHKGLYADHRELRQGQSAILAKLNALEVQYTRLEGAVRAIKPYDLSGLTDTMDDGFRELRGKIDEIKPSSDCSGLRDAMDDGFRELRGKIDGIKPYDNTKLIGTLTGLADTLGEVKDQVDGLERSNSAIRQLINDNYTDIVDKFGELRTALAEKTAEVKEYVADQLRDYATKEDIERIISCELAKLPDPLNRDDLRQVITDAVIPKFGELTTALNDKVRELKEYVAEQLKPYATQEDISTILDGKLGSLPDPISEDTLRTILDEKLKDLPDNLSKVELETVLAEKVAEVKGYIAEQLKPYASREDLGRIFSEQLEKVSGAVGDVKQLINDKHAELVGKYGELTTLIAQKAGEIQAHITAQLSPYATKDDIERIISGELAKLPDPINKDELRGIIDEKLKDLPKGSVDEEALGRVLAEKLQDLPYLKKQDLEDVLAEKLGELSYVKPEDLDRILAKQLANINCATQEDLQRIYDLNRTHVELLREIFDKLDSIEQNYGQQPPGQQPPTQQPAPQPGQPINNAQLDAIQNGIQYIRNELENSPNVYTDEDRRLLADIYHQIEERLGENRGEGNRRFDELRKEISQLRQDLLQGYQGPGQQQGAQQQPPAQQTTGQQTPPAQQTTGQQTPDQPVDQQDNQDQTPDQPQDDSPRLEDEQQPVG
jgi:gas vesicle protein